VKNPVHLMRATIRAVFGWELNAAEDAGKIENNAIFK